VQAVDNDLVMSFTISSTTFCKNNPQGTALLRVVGYASVIRPVQALSA